MGALYKIITFCLYIQACSGILDPTPAQRNATTQCAWCPKKTTTHHTTTHSTTQSTLHTTHSTPITTTHHPTTHTNHTSPHPTTHTNHTSTPHPTTHTNHTSPHPTTHTNHTSPHPTTHTNHTSTPHPTTHTNHTSPHPTAHTNHTSPPPTTVPPSTEYFVNGTTGVCLRITGSFNISLNDTMKQEIVIPPAPSTQESGNCTAEKAWLTLTFPQGQLTITFRQDTEGNNFFLSEVNITLKNTGSEKFDNTSLKAMATPLGRSFSCERVDIQVTSKVSFSAMNVKAQAFKLEGGNYGREMKCSSGPHDMTVPIVVGIILVALILIVIIAYIVARRRSQSGYQPL